jgi:hypothetical protein
MLATALFLPAAGIMLGDRDDRGRTQDTRRFLFAGVLLGLSTILRFHYLPALGLFALMTCGTAYRTRWLPLIAGGVIAAALSAAADGVMGQLPFAWIVENFRQNIVHHRAAGYGVDPPLAYFTMLSIWWQFALPLIFLAMAPAIRANRVLFIIALLTLAIHMTIGHKEYRFIILPTTIFVLIAALGSAQWVTIWAKSRTPGQAAWPLVAVCALWAICSLGLATTGAMRVNWVDDRAPLLLAQAAGRDRALCGIALHHMEFWESGGYTYMHRDLPLYWLAGPPISQADSLARVNAFNAVIAREHRIGELPGTWRRRTCGQGVCLFVRDGGCDPAAGRNWPINRVLLRLNM